MLQRPHGGFNGLHVLSIQRPRRIWAGKAGSGGGVRRREAAGAAAGRQAAAAGRSWAPGGFQRTHTDPELTVHPQERGLAQLGHTASEGLDQALQQPWALHVGGLTRGDVEQRAVQRAGEAQRLKWRGGDTAAAQWAPAGAALSMRASKYAEGLCAKCGTLCNYNDIADSPASLIGQGRPLLGAAAPAACR